MDDYPGSRQTPQPPRGPDLAPSLRSGPQDGAPREPEEEFNLRGVFHSVWRRKAVVCLFGLGMALLAMAAVYAVTPRYMSTAVVMLDQQEDRIIDVESVVSGLTPDFFSIAAEVEVLRSRSLAGRVVDAADLESHPYFNPELVPPQTPSLPVRLLAGAVESLKTAVRGAVTQAEAPGAELLPQDYWVRQQAIDILLASTTVASVGDTYVYALTVETEDPLLSADLANRMAELYILDQLETKFEATQAATEWLSDRVAQLKTDVEQAEAAVEAYNSSSSLISEASLAAMNRQLKELRTRLGELETAQTETQRRVERMRAALDAGDPAAAAAEADAPRLSTLAEDLAATPEGAAGREILAARFQAAALRQLTRLEAERDRAASQRAAVESTVAELESRLESQTRDMVELRQLQREAEATRRIYEQFLRRLNETSVQQGVQQADARILSPAVVDIEPSYPNKTVTVLAAGFFGGLLGIGFVLVLDQLDKSFRRADELERASGLAVLGSIPVAPVRMRRGLLKYAVERPSSALVEAIRNLRTGVLMADVDRPPQVVMLTSSLPREGKTTCSLLLAQNAAGLGRKVLLIECDLRRRTFRTYFSKAPELGMMSILTGERSFDEVVHHDPETGMDVVLGEETKVNAADVFASQRFREFVEEARRRYDFVVIDTPPVLAVPDGRVIAPLADAVLYCVHWNSTHRDLVADGLARFRQIGVRVSGLALTQVNQRRMARLGYGGYDRRYYKTSSRYYLD